MDQPSKTANIDKRTITEFQGQRHLVDDENLPADPIFDNSVKYGEWTTYTPLSLKSSVNESNSKNNSINSTKSKNVNKNITFEVDGTQHAMYNLYIQQELPSIKVKPKYRDNIRIRLINNAAHHIFPTINFSIDNYNFGYDEQWADDYLQFMFDNVYDRAVYEERIGNRSHLREWSTFLPVDTISFPLLFNFSLEEKNAFPIFLFNQKGKINYDLKFNVGYRDQILDLIEMEQCNTVNDEKHWKPIKPSSRYLQRVNKNNTLSQSSEMWGRFPSINSRVRNWIIERCEKDPKSGKIDYEIIVENIIAIDPKNTAEFGTSPDVTLESNTPTQMITFKVQLDECTKYNLYSNYTTSILENGSDPIASDGIKYGISWRYPERSGKHSSRDGIWGLVPSVPFSVGYHAVCNDNMRNPHKLGIVYKHIDNAKLIMTLGQSFPYYLAEINNNEDSDNSEDENDNDNDNNNNNDINSKPHNYYIKVRLLTWSTLKIDSNGEIIYHTGDNDKKISITEDLFD